MPTRAGVFGMTRTSLTGLRPVAEWTSAPDRKALQVLMEEKMSVHPGLLFSFSQPIATRVDELLSGVKAQLAVKLFGPDLDVLAGTEHLRQFPAGDEQPLRTAVGTVIRLLDVDSPAGLDAGDHTACRNEGFADG